jgi:pSer/pThr/pTyr-binding forkhead associated (FHA) protein
MAGGDVAYRPGAHYFATRLYDLDFASVGNIASEPNAEPIVDFPRQTGRISYRKIVVKNGRLVGALMLGEREERVRQRGRAFKRLIDGGIEIAPIRDRLLDPTFDLTGWLRTKSLLARPATSAVAAGSAASPANIRKTQSIQMVSAAGAAGPARATGTNGSPPADLGHLEATGRRFALAAPVVSIGRDPNGQVHLDDPGVSFLHAQITRHDNDLYLRDLGSRNGTWVNRSQVTVPHLLRSGDRIYIGQTELVFRSSATASVAPSGAVGPSVSGSGIGPLPHLEIRSGHAVGIAFALSDASSTLGRDPSNAIRLDDLSVSSRHAVLRQRGGAWFLADVGSTNGTFVRGERLAPERERQLVEGDALQFGQVAAVFTSRAVPDARISSWYSHAPAPTPAPPATRSCVSCGRPLAADARFCTSCGFAVTGGAS